jgi:hypothetical protein
MKGRNKNFKKLAQGKAKKLDYVPSEYMDKLYDYPYKKPPSGMAIPYRDTRGNPE